MGKHEILCITGGVIAGALATLSIVFAYHHKICLKGKESQCPFVKKSKNEDSTTACNKKHTFMCHIRQNIALLRPYHCARDDYTEGILLDANENTHGPVSNPFNFTDLNRYPDPRQEDLKELVRKFRNCKKENIFVGVGSDEAIDLLFRVICVPGVDSVMITPPTYGMYKVCAAINDVALVSVPLKSDFNLDVHSMKTALTNDVKIIFLCSPNNPTSNLLKEEDVLEILEWNDYTGIVVVDEAYIDFAPGNATMCRYLNKYPHLVVLQTCSKSFGLAGIRCGFAFGDPDFIQVMNNVKAPYNLNKLSSSSAISAFKPQGLENLHVSIQTIIEQRDIVAKKLREIPQVGKIHPSDTNFVLFEIKNAKAIYLRLADDGVVIRFRGTELHCNDCLRVSIGTKEENLVLLSKLKEIAAELDV